MLRNKKIILGVTGCIAAYKSAELIRMLKKQGADVWPVMTKNATQFITPLTMRTLSGNPCITEIFDEKTASMPMPHLSLSEKADLLLIVPSTANILGKAANGIADDILSTLAISVACPIVMAPAMNTKMWTHPIVQDNVKKLKTFGVKFIMPEKGLLACGDVGDGKLADINKIYQYVVDLIGVKQDLAGKKILITAGGTREMIDPVRYIGNRSSGKMGFALAQAAADRGAEVTLISASVSITMPQNIKEIHVETAEQMRSAVNKEMVNSDVLIMAAAVADYRASKISNDKIKKNTDKKSIELMPTTDILKNIPGSKRKRIIIGFSVESKDIINNSKKKLIEKRLDMIIANDISAFESDKSLAIIIKKNSPVIKLPLLSKKDLANKILDQISA